jgi:hypothetical protein
MSSKRERKMNRAEEKTPLLKAYAKEEEEENSSSSSDTEDEEVTNDKRAMEDLREAIRERELAERRLLKKLHEEMARLEKERRLEEQLNLWEKEA